MKKAVAILLSVLMLLTFAAFTFASDEQITADIVGYSDARVEKKDLTNIPSITEFISNPETELTEFKISKPMELKAMGAASSTFGGKTIYLANDLDMSEIKNFHPIGGAASEGSTTPFRGTFDGQGYEIKNLTIDGAGLQNVGLFGNVQRATIKNVILGEGCSVIDNTDTVKGNRVGGIVAAITGDKGKSTTIDNCWNKATVEGDKFVGGIVGFVYVTGDGAWTEEGTKVPSGTAAANAKETTHYIKNCTNTGAITATGRDAGGIAGLSQVGFEVTNCRNAGTITSVGEKASRGSGGIIGRVSGVEATITGCINNGAVNPGKDSGGGILGCAGITGIKISNCKNFGAITASTSEGSVTGAIFGIEKEDNSSFVTEEENSGTTSAAEDPSLEIALKADTLIEGVPTENPGENTEDTSNSTGTTENTAPATEKPSESSGTSHSTTAEANENTTEGTENESGCKSSAGVGIAVIGIVTASAAIFGKRRKNRE